MGTAASVGPMKNFIDDSMRQHIDEDISGALHTFLQDNRARSVFNKYVKSGSWKEKLGSHKALQKLSQTVYSKFLSSESVPDDPKREVNNMLEPGVSPMNNILFFAAIFPIFLESSQFSEFVLSREENGVLTSHDEEDDSDSGSECEEEEEEEEAHHELVTDNEDNNSEVDEESATDHEPELRKIINDEIDFTYGADRKMSRMGDLLFDSPRRKKELRKSSVGIDIYAVESAALKSECIQKNCISWLEDFLAYAEDHSNSISLATARKDRPGFPLIYVNKAFERITGYSRADVLGKNCRFLQCEGTEKEEVQKMAVGLATATVVRVAITNRRKDGSSFFNLLALKPIFDRHGAYSYVIAAQYPVEYDLNFSAEVQERDIQNVEKVMSVFPNTMW